MGTKEMLIGGKKKVLNKLVIRKIQRERKSKRTKCWKAKGGKGINGCKQKVLQESKFIKIVKVNLGLGIRVFNPFLL